MKKPSAPRVLSVGVRSPRRPVDGSAGGVHGWWFGGCCALLECIHDVGALLSEGGAQLLHGEPVLVQAVV
eukprot:scaffold6903_cov62-Isochrysis_galbana.AAC.1